MPLSHFWGQLNTVFSHATVYKTGHSTFAVWEHYTTVQSLKSQVFGFFCCCVFVWSKPFSVGCDDTSEFHHGTLTMLYQRMWEMSKDHTDKLMSLKWLWAKHSCLVVLGHFYYVGSVSVLWPIKKTLYLKHNRSKMCFACASDHLDCSS